MQQYLELLEHILIDGVETDDRTGVGTISVFGDQLRFDLSDGFPLVTTKKVFVRGIIHELLWFLNGDTNIKYLNENSVHIWDPWADDKGNLGPIYGAQWTAWRTGLEQVNQIESVVNQIKADPHSRRHIVASWNVSDLPYMALPPCHCLFQFYVADGKLSCQLYQRSADAIIGTPFNIASYALLTMMVAQVCDLEPGEFIHTFGDVHIYKNHIDNANLQLEREPYPLPTMGLNPAIKDIFGFSYEDFTLSGYRHHPAIKSEVAV